MNIIFRVNETKIFELIMSKDNSKFDDIIISDKFMARLVFPKIFNNPTLGDLLVILRLYAGTTEKNLTLNEIAKENDYHIDFIEFKQNLNILFEK
ncbi:TPA: hypothetical protein ACONAJ_001162 [Staphylococcus aureus]